MSEEENIQIEMYLSGILSGSELVHFQKRFSEDGRFRESVLLQKQLQEALNEDSWSFAEKVDLEKVKEYEAAFRGEETRSLAAVLKKVNTKYQETSESNVSNLRKWLVYAGAAVIAALLVLNLLLPSNVTPLELYATNFDLEELPSLVVRGEQEEQLTLAQSLFERGDYQQALSIFKKQLPRVEEQKATVYLYQGISEMQLEAYEAASETFKTLSRTNLIDASKGLWYAAVVEMKKGDEEELRRALEEIVSSPENYKFNTAKSLLDEL